MAIQSINPSTGEVLQRFDSLTPAQVEEKLERSRLAYPSYRKTSIETRAAWMLRAAEILETEAPRWGRLMTLEMGKPIQAARDEAKKCAWACRYYAENAAEFLKDQSVRTEADQSFVRHEPLGAVLAIMPWNFPFWQVVRFAAPALMSGNVGLLKHASNVPQCSLALQEIFERAGFPSGVFQSLLIPSRDTARVIEDPRVVAVTLTGSDQAGSQVAALAGKHIKKTVLELGGSDPFIVMPSADLDRVAAVAVKARTINNGQSCIAAKRFIVDEKVSDSFLTRITQKMAALRVGDPLDEATELGPLSTEEMLHSVSEQVEKTVRAGARILTGGKRLGTQGYFYAPTVLTEIPKDSPGYRDEVFGPVALCFKVNGIREAIALANDSRFGLGSSLWTENEEEKRIFIEEIESGAAFVNGMVASDPRLPFGGIKHSGYGRELSRDGILEFVNRKTVWMKHSSR